ncbi:HTTM domain-containing protein [Tenacibaculum discolor]|uniref:HTTM domain-containing protein n=1 Tax=Tenacibaculum discolor TaxID=361581 RepID=A0A2G1BQ79_9FLAO|nr:HTTM domain-containing protein [Tenacibaculum discolor]MDP2541779.1 HTTM domain-containing protein [Tenacibaculum discolor]PHN96213.1 HTTM domain-containing protein [Tenacibaculum discolor]PHN99416.1 HTTM domain-containing protein [Rhodobacteraceae bacterium 4F10]
MISKDYLSKQTKSVPLAVFRVFFGVMMLFGILRFWYHGWIEKLYVQPTFHFSYYGFEWIKPIGNYTYLLFIISGLSAALVALGFKYRLAIITFFLSFTYIELMDKTTYLNHYYFISILSFVLIFLPANARFSLDAYLRKREYTNVPKWTIDSVKLLLGIVYFYAGLAKLNSDWLLRAQPLKIWLPSKYDLPFIGNNLMQQEWFHYAMSWCGALYDLSIPFLLLYKRTRLLAFGLVVFFHVFTRVLFPIGMFPFIMIVATLIFFDASLHEKIIQYIKRVFSISSETVQQVKEYTYPKFKKKVILSILGTFFILQILLPWRYLLYPGELFWTEEGFRFSWRVMLMEKAGYANFKIVDGKTGEFFYVNNADFLTSFQEKQMSFQPDFILEYAHYLGDHFKKDGHKNIEVYVESFVALNGRLSQPYINPNIDLYKQKESFKHKDWILPFTDKIKIYGL